MNTSSDYCIEIDNVIYQLQSLDKFGFEASVDLASGLRSKGLLTLGSDKLGVAFRVRENKNGIAKCSFSNLSLAGSEMIQKFLRKQQPGRIENAHEPKSHSDVAPRLNNTKPTSIQENGIPKTTQANASMANNRQAASSNGATTSNKPNHLAASRSTKTVKPQPTTPQTTSSHPAPPNTPPRPRSTARSVPPTTPTNTPATNTSSSNTPSSSIASTSNRDRTDSNNAKSWFRPLPMLLTLAALAGLVLITSQFLRSRSTLSVSNSALVGNYLPVSVKAEGEIVELVVAEGDAVKEGDLLMRLKNPVLQMDHKQCAARLTTAKSKVAALRTQLKNKKKRVANAGKSLARDLVTAKAEMKSAAKLHEAAKVNFERHKPALKSGAITNAEFEVVRQELLAAAANKTATQNAVKQIEFEQESAKDNVLVSGDRFDDDIERLTAKLAIAEAEQQEIQLALGVANEQFNNLNVTAPRDGTVYVTYRQVGEYVKVADQTMGLSLKGKVWAAGQVTAEQSRHVRPGQPVIVTAPSLGQSFEGVVSAVGHQALYSDGNYMTDFHGETSTDVPIKVIIQNLPEDVPSGIHLQMAIKIGFGVDWLDRTMGYSLRSISDGQPIEKEMKKEASPAEPDIGVEVIGEVVADM